MKKLSIIIVIFVVIGAIWFLVQGKNSPKTNSDAVKQQANTVLPEQNTPIISSIKDAMGLGKKMACSYTSATGTPMASTVFIDGEKIKFMTTVNGETMYGLFDDETQYTWTIGEKKQGMKMSKTCLEELKKLAPPQMTNDNAPQTQDYQTFENMQNVNCVEASNEDFSLPANVTFIDQCEMMRNAMSGMNQLKEKLPEGIAIPTNY